MNVRIVFLLILGVTAFMSCSDDGGVGIIPIAMGTVEPNVGGVNEPNQVYIDLTTGLETVIPRKNWDLAFSCDQNFRVALNGSNGMLAAPTNTTDFAEVTEAMLAEFPFAQMNMDALFGILVTPGPKPMWFDQAQTWVDNPDGKIDKTAFDEVNALDASNPVYIVNRGKNDDGTLRGFMKVKVDRMGNGYTVRLGDLDDAVGESYQIEKDNDFNFIFIRKGQGPVLVEPKKTDWDICFSTYTDYVLSEFTSGFPVPYTVLDYVFLNRFGTSAATVVATEALADFQAFTLENSIALGNSGQYKASVDAIGTDWRTVATPQVPGSVTAPQNDRFYVVADSEGIPFKIIFTRMSNATGDRGFPEFIYEELR